MDLFNTLNRKELAYLIGAVMGDGSYCSPNKWGKQRFSFSSSDKEFILIVKKIIKDTFDVKTGLIIYRLSLKNRNWRDHYKITSRPLIRFLTEYLPDKNKIPLFIRNSDKNIKAEFISGFFDAEGGISISTIKSRKAIDRRLYCHNSNLDLLEEIKSYLEQFDVNSFIQNGKGAFALNIWGYKNLVNFKNSIGFRIYRKNIKLIKAINSYKIIRKEYRHLRIDNQKLQGECKMTEDFETTQEEFEQPQRKREDDHTVFVGAKPFNRV